MTRTVQDRLNKEGRALAAALQCDATRRSLSSRSHLRHWVENNGHAAVLFPYARLRCCGRHQTWTVARPYEHLNRAINVSALRDAVEKGITTRLFLSVIRGDRMNPIDPFVPLMVDGKVFVGDIPEAGHVRSSGVVVPRAHLELQRMLHEVGHFFLHRNVWRTVTEDSEFENDTVGDLFLLSRGLIHRRAAPVLYEIGQCFDEIIASRQRISVAMNRMEGLLPSASQLAFPFS